jgi:Prophage antirepressor
MQNELQVFVNEEFGTVRVIEVDGVPWFIAKDVTDALQYGNSRQAIKTNVADEDRDVHSVDTRGGKQKLTVINESGLYSLILSSRLPSAKRFKRWLTSEILPTIRQYGAYITRQTLERMSQDREYAGTLLLELSREYEKNDALLSRLNTLTPKAAYYDNILSSENAIPVSIIAKDYGLSAVAFNKLLHELGIQYKVADTWVLYQKHDGKGYTKSRTYCVSDNISSVHTRWTQKGRRFIYDVLAWYGILPVSERFADMSFC